ncbi:RNA 3'-terminal phosphate cyclase [Haloferula rosea]|uniref:RNA 3'-terminal phosphate cyclase n=1 Tax=Haloferula rosea TaxID=490093 RepID=A0A934RA78_9BACT|nr:RNA 3'-terminal phosphate cyclase [Haloferula rosea]MBK1827272.1 RNA 3'-terminal phosphate cyclase [Haloferula rosea]
MAKLIQLDGGSGGGQMLRTALSLSMVTGQPFRMTGIRGKRRKPGLMRQHLTCVRAACEISGGTADGAEIGSTELVFRAGEVKPGSYQFAVGTAGSTSLLLQTLLPALWSCGGESSLRLEGGTLNPMAPPFEYLDAVFLPAMARMGAVAEVRLVETGFAPAGGGMIECNVKPCSGFTEIDWSDRGELVSKSIRVPVRELPLSIAGRILDSALAAYPCEDAVVESREPGPGRGVACLVSAEFEKACEMGVSFGQHGISAERVGKQAAKLMNNFIGSGVAVGLHLADQLLLPMALAGCGRFTTIRPDSHVPTNISVIEKFLPVKFGLSEEDKRWEIAVTSG